jgi:hypothetical protein
VSTAVAGAPSRPGERMRRPATSLIRASSRFSRPRAGRTCGKVYDLRPGLRLNEGVPNGGPAIVPEGASKLIPVHRRCEDKRRDQLLAVRPIAGFLRSGHQRVNPFTDGQGERQADVPLRRLTERCVRGDSALSSHSSATDTLVSYICRVFITYL